jgi:hypothetical protein
MDAGKCLIMEIERVFDDRDKGNSWYEL